MKKSAQDREIEKLKKAGGKTQERERISSKRQTQSQGKVVHCSVKQCQVSFCTQKKEKPNVGLDKETFERMMNLLDDIITPV